MTNVEWQKKYAKSLLRVFKRSGFQSDRLAYIAAQKVYQSIIRKKKKGYQAGKKCVVSKHITDCEWYEHFKDVFNGNYTQGSDLLLEDNDTSSENETLTELNRPIDPQQVCEAVRQLKSGKAHSCDGILTDMLTLPGDTAVKFLKKLFNAVCNEGLYPEEWSKAIIIQIFMKGNKNNIDNYGGISLLSLISK